MGIRVFDRENMFSDEECSTCCSCSHTSCAKTADATTANGSNNYSSAYTTTSTATATTDSNSYRDIVNNCKEMLIETNSCNLRIVGNNNRIRITVNTGNLIVIGNNTRLKIKCNYGQMKYIGNNGRIKLGTESEQQFVEYIGCNGTLKIVNSMKFSKNNHNKNKSPANREKCCETVNCCCSCRKNNEKQFKENSDKKSSPMAASTTAKASVNQQRNHKTKEKSHSYGGASSPREQSQWQTFNALFNDVKKTSLPNLTHYEEMTNRRGEPAAANIVQTIGNLVIANASNVCISPYVRNVTAKA